MEPSQRTGAQYVVESLRKAGVKYIFGIPGHGNVWIFDEARDLAPDINVVQVKHEQWGGHMADARSRTTSLIATPTALVQTPRTTASISRSAQLNRFMKNAIASVARVHGSRAISDQSNSQGHQAAPKSKAIVTFASSPGGFNRLSRTMD